jgi:hypothetical protein
MGSLMGFCVEIAYRTVTDDDELSTDFRHRGVINE